MKIHNYIYASILLLFTSCTMNVNIDVPPVEPLLVINGVVKSTPERVNVTIQQSSTTYGKDYPEDIAADSVLINGERLKEEYPGSYLTEDKIAGKEGEKFNLEVYIDFDKDGVEECYTATATMPRTHIIDSVSLEMIYPRATFKQPLLLAAYFQETVGEDYYGALLYINGSLYSNRLKRWYVHTLNDYSDNGGYIHFPISEWVIDDDCLKMDNEDTWPLFVGDVLTVELLTLDKPYYEYLKECRDEISKRIPLISAPASNIKGNISGGALGCFGAYSSSSTTYVIPAGCSLPEK